ncbi:MAG: hypothetical protein ACJ8AI_03180 [Rhodopila sp.]
MVDALHHQFWGDELHAWGLVAGSANIAELFSNLHRDGHPGLWHLMLWSPSMLSLSPDGMRLVAVLSGVAIITTIGIAAPFSLAEKLLLLSNYFIVFEYTVMARNYGIGLLLAMCYAIVRRKAPDRSLLIGLLLGLMAKTNVYAMFLAACLALEYLWSQMAADDWRIWPSLKRLLPGGILYVMLMLFSVWTIFPRADTGLFPRAFQDTDSSILGRGAVAALRALVAPFAPIDLSFPASFSSPGEFFQFGKRVLAMVALLPFILAALWTVLRQDKRLPVVFASMALIVTVFQLVAYPAAIRHLGVMFIAFVAIWWLVRERVPARSWPVLGLLLLG